MLFSVFGTNGLAIEPNNEETNPCDNIFCSAGRDCVTNLETNEAKCECVQECPYEVHPRRMVKIFQFKKIFSKFSNNLK